MSITSSNNQELHPDFTDLLARHAGLAGWLSNALYTGEKWQVEDLWPRFLAECTEQGIAETTYPFTAEDQGLADLRVYLQNAWEELDAFHLSTPDLEHTSQVKAHSLKQSTQEDEEPTHIISTMTQPASQTSIADIPKGTNIAMDTTEALNEVPQLEFPHTPINEALNEVPQLEFPHTPINEAQEDVPQLEFPHMPINEITETDTSEKDTLNLLNEAANGVLANAGDTVHIAEADKNITPAKDVTLLATTTEPDSIQKTSEDVTLLATAQVPATTTEPDSIQKTSEDVTLLATAQVPATTTEPDSIQKTSEDVTLLANSKTETDAEPEPVRSAPARPARQRDKSTLRRRSKRPRRPRSRRQKIISWILLIIVLTAVLVPGAFLVNFGVSAYNTYHDLSNQAHNAVNHLLDVKNEFSSNSSNSQSRLSGLLNPTKLQRAEQDFIASGQDFQQLQKQLKHSSTIQTLTAYLPQYRETLTSAQAASQIGIDIARIGQIATAHASQIAPSLSSSGSLLAPTGKPLVTQALLDTLNTTIDQITPFLNDVELQAQNVSLASLPISASEKTQMAQALQLLPQVISDLGVARSMLGEAGWLLGVAQPRTFLVQTMDRAELRGSGGFTGQYGELTVNGGRIAPFSLKDISLVEYTNNSTTQGQQAPQQYRSWWPFANWGLRDSNISADFPTTAQTAISLYKQETGNTVDGVISFTPVVIEHVLAVIGPIQVPGYNTTVTAQNLEDVLHYYQLDNSGILKQILSQPGNTSTSQRKRFTNYLTTLLMAKVRNAPPDQLLAIAHQVLADLKSKDLQMYFSDPATENVLVKYGYAGTLDRSTTHDGLYVVQQNLSASKASQYVQTIMHDTVTLDSKGGATHVLQLRLVYNQAGPVYGYDTYYDYLRVYVPPSSQFLSGDGFSSGTPLCGGSYGNCPINGVYPSGELLCPAGQYQPGASPPSLTGSDGGTWEPLQTLSGPTNMTSDEAGRAMYGGWVIIPKNCTMNVTLSWYVPPMPTQPYSLLVQRQAGTFPELDLTILPDAADCTQLSTTGLHYDAIMTKDISFALPTYHASTQSQGQSCYPYTGV